MDQINHQEVFSDSECYQPTLISSYNSQDNDILISSFSPSGQIAGNFPSNDENASNVTCIAQSCNSSVAQTNPSTNRQISAHPAVFFFRPPNDCYHYQINCKEISCDTIECLLNKSHNTQSNENECNFFYKQKCNNQFYQVSCIIVSPFLVNNCLNKNFLGFEIQQQNTEQEYLVFTIDQKEKLQYHLKKYLSQYFLN